MRCYWYKSMGTDVGWGPLYGWVCLLLPLQPIHINISLSTIHGFYLVPITESGLEALGGCMVRYTYKQLKSQYALPEELKHLS
uniref:Uncharacterized protein n=1 Tax=Engystomops pustulosus TaxID=76066 RepID=A0AAV6YPU4_ENGPU|nr:hypothetical protein GDO81_025617 [Engystomops pustulosus]